MGTHTFPHTGKELNRDRVTGGRLRADRAGADRSAVTDPGFSRAYAAAFEDLNLDVEPVDLPAQTQPATQHLPVAFEQLKDHHDAARAGNQLEAVTKSLRELVPHLHWTAGDEAAEHPQLAAIYAETDIIGEHSLAASADIEMGLALLAPNSTYPAHRHPPEEFYLVLSDAQWRGEDPDEWIRPGVGGGIWNPHNVEHAMRSQQHPLFAIWCLRL